MRGIIGTAAFLLWCWAQVLLAIKALYLGLSLLKPDVPAHDMLEGVVRIGLFFGVAVALCYVLALVLHWATEGYR